MGNQKTSLFFILLTLLIICSQMVVAQVITGTISGIVTDETGAIVPGVTVSTTNLGTELSRVVITDDEGRYRAPNLSLGPYEIRAQLTGFQSAIRRGITLTVGREAIVDFTLRVGQMADRVEVVGEAPLVEVSRSAITGLVDEKIMVDLPLNGRSFDQLSLLTPGVTNARQNSKSAIVYGSGLFVSASGARPNQNSYLLDGTDINNLTDGPGSAAGVLLGVDTVREFEILVSNYDAEYGRAAGAVISAATKSGTNELHGSIFEFHRNSALDARNFFDVDSSNPTQRSDPPSFKRNQFGFSLGGPIYTGKTFFFGAYEGLREGLGVTQTATVPNEAARQGLLPDPANPGDFIDVGLDPGVKPFLDQVYPLPNGADFGDGTGFFSFSETQVSNEDFFQIRIDHNFSDTDSLFGRYTFTDAERTAPASLPKVQEAVETRNQYLTLEEKHIFSPVLLNVIRFGFNRSNLLADSFADPSFSPALSFVPGEIIGANRVSGLTSAGSAFANPRVNLQSVFEITDTVTYTRGRHSLKFGVNYKRFLADPDANVFLRGFYFFTSLENFLTGNSLFFRATVPGTDASRQYRQNFFGFYVQDDFHVLPNLTLNLGLRYEFVTVPTELDGKESFLPDILAPAAVVGPILQRNPGLKNFGPRIGFAWDPFSDGKTSIRAGFGIFYEQILPRTYFTNSSQMPPFFLLAQVSGVTFPSGGFEEISNLPPSSGNDLAIALHPFVKTPSTLQWNLNIQREVMPSAVFTVGYVGSRGVNLFNLPSSNTAIPQILPDGRKFFAPGSPNRNPNFPNILFTFSAANSFYHGLQLSFNKRYGETPIGPLQYQFSYTFAKSIDDASTDLGSRYTNSIGPQQDPDDIKADRGFSSFDIRHNFVANFVYEIPVGQGLSGFAKTIGSGWQINGIATIASSLPLNASLSFSRSGAGRNSTAERPNLKPGFSNNPTEGFETREQWFDTNAFELQPVGFFGDLGRNTIRGPDFISFDFSVLKNTAVSSISENFNVQFRVEFFNIFNRPSFATPSNARTGVVIFNNTSGIPLGNAATIFDTVSSSRQIQFGLKLLW